MHTLEQLRGGALRGIRRLQLACGLTEFPREIFDLADSLEILDLTGNALSALPDDLSRLTKLRIIFCSNNQFTELPAALGACPALSMVGFKANRIRTVPAASLPAQLRWLVLTDNEIDELPAELGRRPLLQKLMLAGNRLRALPATMADLHRLELLRISANRLTELPAWLPALPRLTWLAYAGNPFCATRELAMESAPAAAIDWEQLRLEDKLGEGASGVIYRAAYRDAACRRQTVQRHDDQRRLAAVRNGGLHRHRCAPKPDSGAGPGGAASGRRAWPGDVADRSHVPQPGQPAQL
jgi:hypothetical protein